MCWPRLGIAEAHKGVFIINDRYVNKKVLFITLILAFPHAHDNLLQEFCWLQAYRHLQAL